MQQSRLDQTQPPEQKQPERLFVFCGMHKPQRDIKMLQRQAANKWLVNFVEVKTPDNKSWEDRPNCSDEFIKQFEAEFKAKGVTEKDKVAFVIEFNIGTMGVDNTESFKKIFKHIKEKFGDKAAIFISGDGHIGKNFWSTLILPLTTTGANKLSAEDQKLIKEPKDKAHSHLREPYCMRILETLYPSLSPVKRRESIDAGQVSTPERLKRRLELQSGKKPSPTQKFKNLTQDDSSSAQLSTDAAHAGQSAPGSSVSAPGGQSFTLFPASDDSTRQASDKKDDKPQGPATDASNKP